MKTTTHLLTTLVLSLTALLTGCDPGGAIYVDSRFTAEERQAIQEAAGMWEAVGAPIDLIWDAKTTGRDTSRRELVRAGTRAAIQAQPEMAGQWCDGYTDHGRIIINVERAAEMGDPLKALVAHEMGHLLGLQHVGTAETAVMSAQREIWSPTELTAVDVAALCSETGMGCAAVRTAASQK